MLYACLVFNKLLTWSTLLSIGFPLYKPHVYWQDLYCSMYVKDRCKHASGPCIKILYVKNRQGENYLIEINTLYMGI